MCVVCVGVVIFSRSRLNEEAANKFKINKTCLKLFWVHTHLLHSKNADCFQDVYIVSHSALITCNNKYVKEPDFLKKILLNLKLKSLSRCFFFLPPQIYYKAVRDIEAGEELLVYMKDGIFPEGSMAPNLQGKINARH